uniref:DNA-directed DNA polymerase n=1 Tax=Meloidogyne enterolobii TaxID=390850 RepID=A0A6V7XCW0_MELEN|nr:unnamed protein product [Meloidogyne enterolobii]
MQPTPPKKIRIIPTEGLDLYVKKLSDELKFTQKFNLLKLSSKFLITNVPNNPESLLGSIFQYCIDQTLLENHERQMEPDQLGCIISSQNLDSDIWIPIRVITSNTVDSILNQFLKVAQSKKQDNGVLWGAPFLVSVTTIQRKGLTSRPMHGSGRSFRKIRHKINDNALIKIRNSDAYCLFYALMVTFVHAVFCWPRWKFYNYLHSRRGMKKLLEQDTLDLMVTVGAPLDTDSYDAEEWVPRVVDLWNTLNKGWFKVFIFEELGEYKPQYKYGPDNFDKPIILYYNKEHFDGVRRASDLFGQPYCLSCEKIFSHQKQHDISCKARCPNCSRVGPGFPCKSLNDFCKHCSGCGKDFRNENCYKHHITSNFCNSSKKCEKCGVIWDVKDNNRNGRKGHVCSERYCKTCGSYHDPKRGCYIKPLVIKPTKAYRIVAFDFETMQYRDGEKGKLHEVNFIGVKVNCPGCINNGPDPDCSVCGGYRTITFSSRHFRNTNVDQQNLTLNPLSSFVSWIIMTKSLDTIAFSHFGGRFDMVLVFKELFLRGFTPEMIKKGNRLYEMKVKVGKKNWVIFRDTFNLMPMSLASLVPAFALSVEDKPFFPHMVNRPENYGKEIFPVKDDYLADGMMPEKRAQFDKWYELHKNEPFNLDEALASYCTNDVEILMAALVAFRREFLEVSNGLDVLREAMTIASACMKHFRTNHLPSQHLGIVPEIGYDNTDNQSLLALRFLSWYAEEHNVTVRNAYSKEGEKRFGDYRVDGWVEERKLVIEVNGCCWHGCRKCFPDDEIRLPNGISAGKQREKDERRLEFIESFGVEVEVYWECDIRGILSRDRVMRLKFKNYLDNGPIDIRSAFFGGRTGPLKLFHKTGEGQKISYYDVTSLYPFINMTTRYPIGHPEVHILNNDVNWTRPSDNTYELALLKVFVIPPRSIGVPVLPMKIGDDDETTTIPPLLHLCKGIPKWGCERELQLLSFRPTTWMGFNVYIN